MEYGVMKKLSNEPTHNIVQCGRKQKPLSSEWCGSEKSGDGREEPRLAHVISFIDDGYLNVAESQGFSTHEIFRAAWGANENISGRDESTLLVLQGFSAHRAYASLSQGSSHIRYRVGYLKRKLSSWFEDEGSWKSRL